MKSDWLLLAMTAVIGLLCGLWLYATVFVPEYVHNPYIAKLEGEKEVNEINLVAEMYGGCTSYNDCIAFEIRDTGHYRFSDGSGPIMAGKLSGAFMKQTRIALTEDALSSAAQPTGAACPVRDAEYVYDIYRNGTYYRLDTCATEVDASSGVAQALRNLFNAIDDDLYARESTAKEAEDKTPILRRPTEVLFGATTTAEFENRQVQQGADNADRVEEELLEQ